MSKKKKIQLPSEYLESRPELLEVRITALKLALSFIPYIGSALNEILFDLPNRIQQRRINETVEILNEKFKVLEISALNKEYLDSSSFFDFTHKLFEESLKIESIERRKMLASVYVQAIKESEDYESGRTGLFMKFIGEIQPEQMRVLKFIEDNESLLLEIGSYAKFFQLCQNSDYDWSKGQYDFKYYCSDLENKSLISLGAGLDDFRSKSAFILLESHERASVTITELGQEFLEHLKDTLP